MYTKELADPLLTAFSPDQTRAFALSTLLNAGVPALPMVEDGKVTGFIESRNLSDLADKTPLRDHGTDHPGWCIHGESHYMEALLRFGDHSVSCLAITDAEMNFTGIVSHRSLIAFLAGCYSSNSEGGILILDMPVRNYSLSELSRIVENDGAKILGVTVFSAGNNAQIQVQLKLNTVFTDQILSSFRRFGYEHIISFFDKRQEPDYESRYLSLLKYMEF